MSYPDRTFTVAAGVLGLFVLAGAAGAQKLEIKTHQDPKADFKPIKTYAWLPPPPEIRNVAPDAVSNPTLSLEVLGPRIVSAVDRQLTTRGLTQTDREKADVHVAYFAALTVGFQQSYLGEHYGYITGWASPTGLGPMPSTSMTVLEKGTVIVDVVQPSAKRAIWRGTAVTRVLQETTLEKRVQRINEAAERMFQRFPIRPK
jgi:hypothetical protein